MGDLQTRISIVKGMEANGYFKKIIARISLSQMQQYSSSFKTLTQGRVRFNIQFVDYAPVPYEVQKKLTEACSKRTANSE